MPFQNAFVSSLNLCRDTINKKGKGDEKLVGKSEKKERKKSDSAKGGRTTNEDCCFWFSKFVIGVVVKRSVTSGGMKVQFTAAMGWTWSAS